MAWTISWLGDTRERFQALMRDRFRNLPIPGDKGLVFVNKLEEEIKLYPIPSADLPQFKEDQEFDFGGVRVYYHLDSEHHSAEIRDVKITS